MIVTTVADNVPQRIIIGHKKNGGERASESKIDALDALMLQMHPIS